MHFPRIYHLLITLTVISLAWILAMNGSLSYSGESTINSSISSRSSSSLQAMQKGVDSNTGREFSGDRIRAYEGRKRFSVDGDIRKADRGIVTKGSFLSRGRLVLKTGVH